MSNKQGFRCNFYIKETEERQLLMIKHICNFTHTVLTQLRKDLSILLRYQNSGPKTTTKNRSPLRVTIGRNLCPMMVLN